jgi:molybdopterin molybdotransferase
MDFWKIAIKPGRPLAFGQLDDALFFGLPGNPVAVMVTFLQFVRPALQKLSGTAPAGLPTLRATAHDRFRKKPGRREYQRGILSRGENDEWYVSLTGRQGSGILSSMSRANCLVVLEEARSTVNPGETVAVHLLPWTIDLESGPDND